LDYELVEEKEDCEKMKKKGKENCLENVLEIVEFQTVLHKVLLPTVTRNCDLRSFFQFVGF